MKPTLESLVNEIIESGSFRSARKPLIREALKVGTMAVYTMRRSKNSTQVLFPYEVLRRVGVNEYVMNAIVIPGSKAFRDFAAIIFKMFDIGVLQDEECFWMVVPDELHTSIAKEEDLAAMLSIVDCTTIPVAGIDAEPVQAKPAESLATKIEFDDKFHGRHSRRR